MHSHSDMLLLEDGDAQSKIRQGVTTEILGEDTSAGPRKGKLARSAATACTPPTWTTLGGYFDALEARGIAVNVASYVGLGTLLGCVLGDSLDRPDRARLEAMKELLDEAMRDGAIGLSTMLASPRELAVTTDDLVELAAVVKRHGGLYSSHIRNEGTEVFAAVKEAIDVGRRAGVPGRHHPPQDRRPVALGPHGRDRRADRRRRGARGSTSRPTSIPTRAATTTWSASSRPGRTREARPR